MSDAMLHSAAAIASAMAVAGFILGLGYFASLRRTVALFGTTRRGFTLVALTVGRIGGAVLFLFFAARQGALPLLAAFFGFLLARALALRAARREG